MRKFYLTLLVLCAFALPHSNAQQIFGTSPTQIEVKKCYTAEWEQQYREANPGAPSIASFENWLQDKIVEQKQRRQIEGVTPTVTIPVVFHIIHNGTAIGTNLNLSGAIIQQQILQINKDFSNNSNSIYAVSEDMGIRFALAGEDPGGNTLAEPGIDRINRNDAGFTAPPYTVGYQGSPDYLNGTIKPRTIWDPERYLNIWVTDLEAGILGIATFPLSSGLSGLGGSESNTTAGVSISYATVGSLFSSNSCSSYGKGRTLTHELGHFFGLRHIWGDGVCATDYCDDTPTHQAANNGVPLHPKPNSCGTADEMFENYMDYTDDIVTNTFTTNQADRMEAVMANSPRRKNLATSTVTKVPVTGSNKISFSDCNNSISISEKGISGATNRYRDLNLYLNVENAATGAATVTITKAGTAVENKNYQILNPTAVFATGDMYKPVTVRILDNAEVDGDVTLSLAYTISGTGVTAGSAAQNFTIKILDDDDVIVSQGTFNLIDESFDAGTIPTGWGSLISTGYVNKFRVGLNGNANGTGAAAYVSNDDITFNNTYSSAASGAAVLRSVLINPNKVKSLNSIQFKYRIWGSSSDVGYLLYTLPGDASLYFWGTNATTTGRGPYYGSGTVIANTVTLPVPAIIQTQSFNINYYFTTNGSGTGFSPGLNVDDIKLVATGYPVEAAVSSSYTYNVITGNTHDNNFRSTNDNMILNIKNANQTINNLTAAVSVAGNNKVAINTSAGSSFRTEKVISLNPAVANTTAGYQVTLLYTTAELTAWGEEVSSLKIMKVKNGNIAGNNYSPANAVLIPTTFSDQSAKGYYAFTGTVTDGFSDFVLVSNATVLPVNLLAFDAVAQKTSIDLIFSTNQEINNKGFNIERSTDAVHYENIGFVTATGNSGTTTQYKFTDNYVSPKVVYYYRLRQVDFDNGERLSMVRQAKIEGAEVYISLTPNPAKNKVRLFVTGAAKKVNIQLYNAEGKMVRKWTEVQLNGQPVYLNINGLSKGNYTISILNENDIVTKPLIIQ